MNYQLIFYRSGRTGRLEKLLTAGLAPCGAELSDAVSASTPEELVQELKKAVEAAPLVFIIGGQNEPEGSSAVSIVGKTLRPVGRNKLWDESLSPEILLKHSRTQAVLLMPDEEETVQAQFTVVKERLKKHFRWTETPQEHPSPEEVSQNLDHQLSGISRTKVTAGISTAEKRHRRTLRSMKTTMIVLLVLGILQLAAAGVLFFLSM